MKVLGISNHGLAVIAMLVCTLWGVIFMERAMNQRAEQHYEALLRGDWPTASRLPRAGD